jgi:hypothetical protein
VGAKAASASAMTARVGARCQQHLKARAGRRCGARAARAVRGRGREQGSAVRGRGQGGAVRGRGQGCGGGSQTRELRAIWETGEFGRGVVE